MTPATAIGSAAGIITAWALAIRRYKPPVRYTRCRATTTRGRQCRLQPQNPRTGYCVFHEKRPA